MKALCSGIGLLCFRYVRLLHFNKYLVWSLVSISPLTPFKSGSRGWRIPKMLKP